MNPQQAEELFPTLEHWLSFNELFDQRVTIFESFFAPATQLIRQHFAEKLDASWTQIEWGSPHRDTQWYLSEFGPNSLCLVFGWCYELQLRLIDDVSFDSHAITAALETNEYAALKNAFERIDRHMQIDSKLMERGNYTFGIPNDRNLSWNELAWCARFKAQEFAEQAIRKIERFTKNTEVTEQIRKLNEIGRDAKQA
ncbi:hypothetical protein [Coraliomargarita parva]|uniref:hypothetical protein n=1 Tax=Coraliomargarita parva TaxID=3014050 RepID=UPI0022B59B60|nr:hypothetical protein [Coraliomargarita parva]